MGGVDKEIDENSGPFGEESGLGRQARNATKYLASTATSSAEKNKILTEKNDDATFKGSRSPACFAATPQAKRMVASDPFSTVSLCGDGVGSPAYDPMTNYTSPRPQFLRYNPNRRFEILMRIEGERSDEEDELGGDSSLSSEPSAEEPLVVPSKSSESPIQQHKEVEVRNNKDDDDEEDIVFDGEERKPRWLKTAWNLCLVMVLLFANYYFSSMNSGFVPSLQEQGDLLEGFANIQGDQGILSENLMARFLGLSEVCSSIPRKELTCGIEDGPQEHESSLEVMESIHAFELVAVKIGENDEENINEATRSIEQQECSQGATFILPGERIDETAAAHSTQAVDSADLPSDSSKASETELVDPSSSNDQDAVFGFEEAKKMDPAVLNEWFYWSQTCSIMGSGAQEMEGDEAKDTRKAELEYDNTFVFSPKNSPHLLLSVYLLILTLSYFLYNSSLRYWRNLFPPSPSSGLVVRDKFMSSTRVNKHIQKKISTDAGVCSKPESSPSNEGVEFTGSSPPVVQLLGEFTVFERTKERKADLAEGLQLSQYSRRSAMKKISTDAGVCSKPESSPSNVGGEFTGSCPPVVQLLGEFTVSERTKERKAGLAEESQSSQYSRRSAMKNISSSANKDSTCLSEVSSNSKASQSLQKQMEENPGVLTEAMKMASTPLRRSSRLQNRVTLTLR
ncbi:hypothetical protein Cni_G00140 [Canna indica]|uniref:Uncharacterized protein n=1 Tax=Canna indica TaxID=4628 RepID=A0AAQ3PZ09_9LILI|nr:hypothetical protein Cni_G00140 [Canna indica]